MPDTAREGDAPSDLERRFWILVGVFNVALFAGALGILLIGFEGRWTAGTAALAIGLFAFGVGLRRYRAERNA